MKKVLSSIILLLGLVSWIFIAFAAAKIESGANTESVTTSSNLLVNAGAEAGDLTGFDADNSVWVTMSQSQQTGIVLPLAGSYFFSFGAQSASFAAMTQTIDIATLPEGAWFEAGGYVQTEEFGPPPHDYGELEIEFLDVNSAPLDVYNSGQVGFPAQGGSVYGHFYLTGTIPAESTQANFILKGYLNDGVFLNVFWDSLFFRALPYQLFLPYVVKP